MFQSVVSSGVGGGRGHLEARGDDLEDLATLRHRRAVLRQALLLQEAQHQPQLGRLHLAPHEGGRGRGGPAAALLEHEGHRAEWGVRSGRLRLRLWFTLLIGQPGRLPVVKRLGVVVVAVGRRHGVRLEGLCQAVL